jgi:hypothetical protein
MLKPIITSPRQQQEQQLQQALQQKPQGFWQNLRHIAGTVGRVAGDIVAPGTTELVTHSLGQVGIGPEANNFRARQLAGLQAQDRTEQQASETRLNDSSKRSLEGSQANEADARAQSLENPVEKSAWEINKEYVGPNGEPIQENKLTGQMRVVPNAPTGIKRYEPPSKDKPDTAAEDDQKYEGIVAKHIEGQPVTPEENAFAKAYRDRKTLGQQATNIYTGNREEGKQDVAVRQETLKAYTPAQESAERMNVMTDAYEKAIKNHDQQAMLNLLANHLGMTMGLQKGARMTKDIIHEAQQSQPWLQGMEAKFDNNGYLAGVTLSPNQMRQMVDLGHERYAEDTQKARSTAKYLGAKDDGPDRIPGKATINYYLGQANGDPAKAKELAKQAGWTVQ